MDVTKHVDRQKRKDTNSAAFRISHAPSRIKEMIVERNWEGALEAIHEGITPSSPPCIHCGRKAKAEYPYVRMWAEAAGAVGAMPNVVIQLAQRFGARDETELHGLIEAGRSLEQLSDMTDEAQLEAALEVVKMVTNKRPDLKPVAAKSMQSYAEVEP